MLKIEPEKNLNNSEALGRALRVRRKEAGLTMQQVADEAGLSVGFISQVERGLTAPSLGSLVSLAGALDTPIGAFLEQPTSRTATTRGMNRHAYSVAGADVSYERLSTSFKNSQLHSVIINEPPGHRSEPISHQGEEMFFIIEGEVTVEIDGVAEILRKGDSIHFDSTRVHAIWNHSRLLTSILWCGTMDIFGDAPSPIHSSNTKVVSNTSVT